MKTLSQTVIVVLALGSIGLLVYFTWPESKPNQVDELIAELDSHSKEIARFRQQITTREQVRARRKEALELIGKQAKLAQKTRLARAFLKDQMTPEQRRRLDSARDRALEEMQLLTDRLQDVLPVKKD